MKYESFALETSFGRPEQLTASDMPEIAFAGRSNVGKSSLLNKLLSRKNLARVSSVPGKTATINFFRGDGVRFVDLPGYGYAKVSRDEKKRWSDLMERYFRMDRDIRLVVQLVDMRHPVTQDDRQMMEFLTFREIPFVVVMTKCDKLNKTERQKRLAAFAEEIPCFEAIHAVPFSSMTGEGQDVLRGILEEIADEDDEASEDESQDETAEL